MLYIDQLISGQECGGIPKENLIFSHQKTSRQHGEMITGAISTDATNNAADTTGSKQMQTKLELLPSDHPISSYQVIIFSLELLYGFLYCSK